MRKKKRKTRKVKQRANKANNAKRAKRHFYKEQSILHLLWKLFASFSVVAGIAAVYIQFSPNLIITAPPILDPKKPLKNPFILINSGYFTVYKISWTCEAFLDQYSPGLVPGIDFPGMGFTVISAEPISKLGPKEQTLVTCPHMEPQNPGTLPATSARVTISLDFSTWWVPWRGTTSFGFVTRKTYKDEFVWLPEAIGSEKQY